MNQSESTDEQPSGLASRLFESAQALNCETEDLLVLLLQLFERELQDQNIDLDEIGCIEQLRLVLGL
ncbi:hypothetical protein [Leptolyngbya sp. FACHB-261]|uniref:hypothetical protein n=1 Tax=Leptolyngbya sp. FACHB-261 TaxID=2692806 RepID=UPI001686E609|nr:hypothetical protein [Leptolyngbya sp. FACHB-261]MBD2103995.1 hypothetical protein [Leptolyngbya sp. FACHB-261]